MDVLQQHRRRLPRELGGAVVALHQLLAGASSRRIGELELARERRLLIEHESILAPSGEIMEPHAQCADEALLPRDGTRLAGRHQAVARELAP